MGNLVGGAQAWSGKLMWRGGGSNVRWNMGTNRHIQVCGNRSVQLDQTRGDVGLSGLVFAKRGDSQEPNGSVTGVLIATHMCRGD